MFDATNLTQLLRYRYYVAELPNDFVVTVVLLRLVIFEFENLISEMLFVHSRVDCNWMSSTLDLAIWPQTSSYLLRLGKDGVYPPRDLDMLKLQGGIDVSSLWSQLRRPCLFIS